MTEEMRTSILDVVRSVIEANIDDVQSTESMYSLMKLWREWLSKNTGGSGKWSLARTCPSTLIKISSRTTLFFRLRSKLWSFSGRSISIKVCTASQRSTPQWECPKNKGQLFRISDINLIIFGCIISFSLPFASSLWSLFRECSHILAVEGPWADAWWEGSRKAERA